MVSVTPTEKAEDVRMVVLRRYGSRQTPPKPELTALGAFETGKAPLRTYRWATDPRAATRSRPPRDHQPARLAAVARA